MMSFFISFFITLLFGSLLSFLEGKLVKQEFVMKSGFLFRLLNVLEVIAPFKHFNKLREFVQMKLPPGFPVKLGKMTPENCGFTFPKCVYLLVQCAQNV